MRGRRRVGVLQLERYLPLIDRSVRALLVLGAMAWSSCDEPGTEVIVVVDTVLTPLDEFDRVDIDVTANGRTDTRCVLIGRDDEDGCVRVEAGPRQGGGGFPLALSVVSASGRGQLVARAQLSLAGSTVACRAMSAALEPGDARMLRLEVGRPCGAPDCSSAEVVVSEDWIGSLPPALEPQPTTEPPARPIARVAVGAQHACLIDAMGRVFCWGANERSQLGTRDQTARFRPTLVEGVADAVGIDAGDAHTCAVTGSGEVLCWGGNDAGQIGNGTSVGPVTRPFRSTTGATAVSLGPQHSCAIVAEGVQCWGSNAHFEAGGATNPRRDAALVPGLPANIVRISAGGASAATGARHTCAIDDTGAAWCWGSNATRQLGVEGDDTGTAVAVGLTETLVDIATGNGDTCAIATGGQIHCWGRNVAGTLGFDATVTEQRAPERIDADTSASQISASDAWRCFVDAAGAVWCFGQELERRMGQERGPRTFATPVLVPLPGTEPFAEVSVGLAFGCARPADGDLPWCWGANAAGQLGIGVPGDPAAPAAIPYCD